MIMASSFCRQKEVTPFAGKWSEMLRLIRRALNDAVARRENEFDDAHPGPARTMTGLFHHLDEKKKQKVLTYKGAEYAGGSLKPNR
jgi:hypothetical protein